MRFKVTHKSQSSKIRGGGLHKACLRVDQCRVQWGLVCQPKGLFRFVVVRLCLELAVTSLKWDLQPCVPSLDQLELSHLEKTHLFQLASLDRYLLPYFDMHKEAE